jgi:hypothetical protein
MLLRSEMWNLVTSAGRLDVAFTPSGTDGYDDLSRRAIAFDVFGVTVAAASLEDIIRSKEAANREKDRMALPTLRLLLEKIRERDGPPKP